MGWSKRGSVEIVTKDHAYPLRFRQRLLSNDGSSRVLLIRLLVFAQPRRCVHTPPADTEQLPRDIVTQGLRLAVARLYRQHLGLSVAMMGPCGRRGTDVCRLLRGEEVTEVVGLCSREASVLAGGCARGGRGDKSQTRYGSRGR